VSASAPRILQSADEAPCGSLIAPLSDLANVILRWPSGEGFIMVEATHRAWCPSDGWEWSACEDHDFPAHLIAEGLTEAECRHLSGLSATDALAWCEARDKAATAKRPQPGDVVPWAEVEDGCLYHGGGQFRMVVGGQTGGMFGPDDADIGDMLSGKYPGTHAEEVATWYGIDNHAALVARDLGTDPEAWRKAMREWTAAGNRPAPKPAAPLAAAVADIEATALRPADRGYIVEVMIPPLIVEAHRLITTTATPTKDVAALVGLTPRSLEKRLRRIYGTTARGLRTGAPLTPGRPPSLREEWRVRLTAEERARVDAAIVVGYAAGARSEGEALAAALRRVEEADPARAQASAEATLGRELAALRQKISAERTKWGEERAALEQKIAKQQATIGRLKAEAPANTKPGTVAAKPSIGPKPAPVAAKPPAAPLRPLTDFEKAQRRCWAGKGTAEDRAWVAAHVSTQGAAPPPRPSVRPVVAIHPVRPTVAAPPVAPPAKARPGFDEEVRAEAGQATAADWATIERLGGYNGSLEWRRDVAAAVAQLKRGDSAL